MLTSVVVLNYNDWRTTVEFVSSVSNYEEFDFIVIVDNCSTDSSVNELRKIKDDRVFLIENTKNSGYAAGNNIGARYSVEKLKVNLVFISNPDIKCKDEDIKTIKSVFSNERDVAVATGLIHNFDSNGNPKIFSSFGWKVPTYNDMISNCFFLSYKIRRYVLKKGNYYPMDYASSANIIKVEAVPGCFFAITAEALKSIGYFDEDTFLYFEETILGYQIKKIGKQVFIATKASIFHCENDGKNRTFRQRINTDKRTLRSARIYIKKYLNKGFICDLVYKICFWLGLAERRMLCAVFKR